jgi:hypothetical protein
MSSYLILGETGESYSITSNKELKNLCEDYINTISATSNDILIYDNKGNIYNSINKMQFYSNSKYFLYWKKYFKDEINNYKKNIEKKISNLSFPLSINLNSIPDVDSSMNILKKNSDILTYSPEKIMETYNKMTEFFDKFKNIYKEMKINFKVCEKIKENYQNQYDGLENIFKNNSTLYNICISNLEEIQKKGREIQNNNKNIINSYNDSILQLKKTEIHPEIIKMLNKKNNSSCKYLMDIYYNEKDMNNWRNNCIGKENLILEKINEKEKIINNYRNQIKNEKNSYITPLKNEWNSYVNEYEKLLNEKSPKLHSIITDLGNDFSTFKTKLINMDEIFSNDLYNSNQKYINSINDDCNIIRQLNEKYSDISYLKNLQISLEPLLEFTNKMINSVENFSIKINELFNKLREIQSNLEILIEKIKNYSIGLDQIVKDFKSLLTPDNFLKSYFKSLKEIKRKIIFNYRILNELDNLKSIISQENYTREIFLKENKNNLTSDLIKVFKIENPAILKIDFTNETLNLPNIFSDKEKDEMIKLSKVESKEDSFLTHSLLTQIDELNLTLKYKEKENKDLKIKFDEQEKKIQYYLNEINNLSKSIDEVTENYNNLIIINEEIFNKKKKDKYSNSNIDNKTNEILKLEKKYLDLLTQTNLIKKTFMNYTNVIIEKRNQEKMEIQQYYENKYMEMEDILSSEKNFNREILSNISALKNKNKEYIQNYLDIQEENNNLKKINESILNELNSKK